MLNLIKRIDQIESLIKKEVLTKYNYVYQGLGRFPGQPYHTKINENVNPVVNLLEGSPQSILKKYLVR